MNSALRILEGWTTHQDYLWFLALLAWGGVLFGEWRRHGSKDEPPRYWLIVLAGSGMTAALLELVLLAQHILTPYTRSDMAMGFAQAIGTAALIQGGTVRARDGAGKRIGSPGTLLIVLLAAAATVRYWRPFEGGAVLCAINALAVIRLLRRAPRPITPWAGILLAVSPIIATYGPWAYAIDHGRRTTDWSYFSLPAAGVLMAAGAVLAAEVWRRRLLQALPEAPAAATQLRRDLRRALVVLAAWLAGGVLLAIWYGRLARRAFEENLLGRLENAVLAVDHDLLADAFSPALRVTGLHHRKYADGTPVVVALTPRTVDPLYARLRAQLARIRERNPDFHLFYITTWRQGFVLEFASEHRTESEPDARVVNRLVTSADLVRVAERKSFLEGPSRQRWGPSFTAQAPLLHPVTGGMLGWMVADIEATRWTVTFTQARLQTMALVGAGVGLWALAVAYRLRRESRDAAEQKAAAAAAADRMKSAFLAKVSHELRTPIQSVLGYGELLAGAPLSDAHRAWLNALRSHGDIMLRLVNDLIDLGALQSGAFQLEIAPIRLRRLIDDCVVALRPAATGRGLELDVNVASDVPDTVAADSVRLRQILLNLLTNAVKFTVVGRVSLSVRRLARGRVEFVISDTGPGFSAALRARLFQPFTRLDPASGGSGLGLALVHGLCAAMGGTVTLREGGPGSTFIVELPLPDHQLVGNSSDLQPTARRLSGLRVVIAEDNTLVRELLVAFLIESGATVFSASDGPSALTVVRTNKPDVVLLDIGLPGMDGIAVAQDLRRTERAGLRIIGLSAHAGPLDESRARAAGMDEFFTKPVSLSRLADSLERGPRSAALSIEARRSILDERLRARLAADFASETPRLLDEMHTALAAHDWERLRSRAHYLKNSADVLGVAPLQDACRRLSSFDDGLSPDIVAELLTAVTAAIPEKAFASADTFLADLK
jgi:signal transduction histidine kinase/CheY-like chemotaxis protein